MVSLFTSSTLYILNLDQSASKWVLHESIEVELPRPLNGTLGSLAVKENNSTSWTFYVAVDMGLSNRAHNFVSIPCQLAQFRISSVWR